MKTLLLFATAAVVTTSCAHGQGVFAFSNQTAPTHIGSIDGPLAGSGIWAQMLAGASADALAPVGAPAEHLTRMGLPTGLVFGGVVVVPGTQSFQTAYVEMLAWDGTRWGTALSGVPKDQLGVTDVVPVVLVYTIFGLPPLSPHFTQPAVVPVPEPSHFRVVVLGALCALVFCASRKRLGRRPGGLTRRRGG